MARARRVKWVVAVAALTVACGGEPPKTETAAAPKPPTPKTVEESVARYRECWDYYNKHAWDPFKAC